ncbi:MAG: hypothetical protein PVH68_09090 [Armatimonadota bacterium]
MGKLAAPFAVGWLVWASVPAASGAGEQTAALRPGETYFRLGGRQMFLLGRNATGWQVAQFEPLLRWAGESGERMVRVQLTTGLAQRAPAGEVDEEWAGRWDRVFDMAAANGLYVLPVFGVWADWNDGSKGEKWHAWHRNHFSAALHGPAEAPAELLQDTRCRVLWLQWLEKLVRRWQGRWNILGWEVFSELNLITGSSEDAALAFMDRAAAVVRGADSRARPVTASLAGIRGWPRLFRSDALDFLQVHPYANHPRFRGNLGNMIIRSVRQRLQRYGKPVLIGESGLDASGIQDTLVVAPRAHVGIRHAIWASVVSGAMNGRMLWWEDGYDQYARLDLRTRHRDASAPAARFVEGVDFARFTPVVATGSDGVSGAAIGNERVVLGWFRDAQCGAPDWPVRRVEGEIVVLRVRGSAPEWHVQFHDTGSGDVVTRRTVRGKGAEVSVPLPAFEESIAFKMLPGSSQGEA